MTINTKSKKNGGFTLAEMLIVVGIIVVLMGVSFVAVQSYQRSSTRLELDTIAKEIFIAAQNHLTEAESQGLLSKLDADSLGYKGTLDEDKIDGKQEVYYVLKNGEKGEAALNLLLPSYAVDQTVLSGSYIIRYQPAGAKVLDVFYSRLGTPTFLTRAGTTFTSGEYGTLMGTSTNYRAGGERNREDYGGKIIGWYGGEDPIPTGERLRAPTFEIHNEEKLWVRVTDPNTSAQINYNIKLIVKGKISGAEAYFSIVKKINGAISKGDGPRLQENGTDIILDDITESGLHFAQIKPNKGAFIPGEDLIIQAVAYSSDALANVAMSAEKTTNSLFADPVAYKTDAKITGSDIEKHVAGIANFRHFENLDATVSKLGENSTDEFEIETAGQITDLDWQSFNTSEGNIVPISVTVSSGSLLPVTPAYSSIEKIVPLALSYDGQGHKVSNVTVNHSGAAGLFGTLIADSAVKDLELIDFSITSTSGSAGALAGTLNGCTVTNVLARNKDNSAASLAKTITAPTAGGLIGTTGTGTTVQYSAAAVIVNGSTTAGGLIGNATGTINGCYSGGHTKGGSYLSWLNGTTDDSSDDNPYDVTGATAGGLVGTSTGTITNSYSTCSVSGTTAAGGFAGSASGTIINCYATGLLSTEYINSKGNREENKSKGAFAGTFSGNASDCKYYMIINEIKMSETKNGEKVYSLDHYLGAVGDKESTNGITALDLNAYTYNSFTGLFSDWNPAKPYDLTSDTIIGLDTYYSGKYTLKTVDELDSNLPQNYTSWDELLSTTHYGDWPSPEVFFINQTS